jgi:SAM domain (Sterile alpha motif)
MWQPDLSAEVAVDIEAWLRGLGLEQYASAFRDNDVDAAVLPELTAERFDWPWCNLDRQPPKITRRHSCAK